MEDKALRKGLSVAAIILTVISALLISFNNANGIVYGDHVKIYGMPFIAAFGKGVFNGVVGDRSHAAATALIPLKRR